MKEKKETTMADIKIFDNSFKDLISNGVKFLPISTEIDETKVEPDIWIPSTSSGLVCSHCKITFSDVQQQREHNKLDWHRYNIKQNLLAKTPVTEEEFDERAGDVSSISGSESEKEDSLESLATSQGKLFLKSSQGVMFSLYRCILYGKKEELDDSTLFKRLQDCYANSNWAILMLGGGHFAGAIFQGSTPVLHKTFHCYTVRAGQGGSQSAKDNRSGSAKGAGASLRRYNEAALVQHVRSIVETWKEEIAKCSLIVYRAAGTYNYSVFFGGKVPLLNKSDSRLRTIPFSSRRATFTELKRVHNALSSVTVYESSQTVVDVLQQEMKESLTKRNKIKITNINRAKSRESIERPLPIIYSSRSSSSERSNEPILVGNHSDDLFICEQELSTSNLKNFDDSLTLEEKKRLRRKPKKHKSKNKCQAEQEALHKKNVFELISLGHIKEFELYVQNSKKAMQNDANIINEVLDPHGNTLLHVAAQQHQFDMVKFLLESNADPCIKNNKQQTPYSSTQDKDVRLIFKNFAEEFPDRHNYNKAQIPIPVILTEEQLEKKKHLKKLKRGKEKEKKKQIYLQKQDESEKERFLKLSDREKRALAAERRILSQAGTVIARCFLCATDISGKVPFEYSGNRFCTIECLKAHRLSHPTVLS